MKKINFKNLKFNKKIIIKTLIFLLFLAISFLILKDVFLMDGLILGGDWSVPSGHSQTDKFIENYGNTWATSNNFLGNKTIATNAVPFLAITKVFSLLGLSGQIFPKLLLLIIFTFAGFFIYLLLKSLKLKELSAIIGGAIYITTPIFFNYAIMGWFYILLFAIALLPLAVKYFIKAIEEGKMKFAVIAGCIYALSFIQAQAALWFMMVFLALSIYLIKDKKTFFIYLKTLAIMAVILLLFNSYWLLESLVSLDKGIVGSNIVNSGPSLGMLTHFYPINILRLFSSLYNFQYETVINNSNFSFLAFFLPVLALSALFFKKYKKLVLSFWLIGLIPIMMYILNFNRDLLLRIPFANVIRDFPRFTVLSSFAYAILASLTLDSLLDNQKKILKYLGFTVIIIWFLSIFPWWTGELTNWQASSGPDIRIRLKVFPDEYLKLEKYFSEKKLDQKAFYLPTSGIVGFEDDIKFRGAYHETSDVAAGFSSIPGALSLTDRSLGSTKEYISVINEEFSSNLVEVLSPTNVKYFAIRMNMTMDNKDKIIDSFENKLKNGQINEFFSGEKILVYSRNDFLPHFYSPKSIIISTNSIERFGDIVLQKNYNIRLAIYFNQQNLNIPDQLLNKGSVSTPLFNNADKSQKENHLVLNKYQDDNIFILNKTNSPDSLVNVQYYPETQKLLMSSLPIKGIFINSEEIVIKPSPLLEVSGRVGNFLKIGENYFSVQSGYNKVFKFSEISNSIEVYEVKTIDKIELPGYSFEEGLWQKTPSDCTNGAAGKANLSMRLSKDAYHGQYSLELGSKNHSACITKSFPIKLEKNKIYKYSFDYKSVKGNKISFYYNLIGKNKPYSFSESINTDSQEWNHYETIIKPEEDINKIELYFYAPSDGTQEVVNRYDNIGLSEVEMNEIVTDKIDQNNLTSNPVIENNIKLKEGDNTIEYKGNMETDGTLPNGLYNYYLKSNSQETINTPVIEFKKINPTKYRVIIHQATDNFPLVFSESFHDGWKTYLVKDENSALNLNPADYKILDGNGDDQASLAELKSYLAGGYISALGNGQEKNIKHLKWVDNKEVFDYNEKYKIDFISKNFQDTIQNDNLAPGSFYETWFKKPVADNQNHLMVNGYANSWNINPTELCGAPAGKALCVRNADGSYDLELVVEFWPQRLFYVGLFISGATLFGCLGYLGWDWVRKKKRKEVEVKMIDE